MKGAELIAVKVKHFLVSPGSSFSGRENLACWRCMGEGGRPTTACGHSRYSVRTCGRSESRPGWKSRVMRAKGWVFGCVSVCVKVGLQRKEGKEVGEPWLKSLARNSVEGFEWWPQGHWEPLKILSFITIILASAILLKWQNDNFSGICFCESDTRGRKTVWNCGVQFGGHLISPRQEWYCLCWGRKEHFGHICELMETGNNLDRTVVEEIEIRCSWGLRYIYNANTSIRGVGGGS